MKPWLALSDPMEVVPLDDEREHRRRGGFLGKDHPCFCAPFLRDGVIIHKAVDNREFYEHGAVVRHDA